MIDPRRAPARLTAALCGLTLLALPAQAQETGTLIKHKAAQITDITSKAGARLAAEQFGACVLDRSFGRVSKWVDLPVGSPEYRNMVGSLVSYQDDCVGAGEMSFSNTVLRGAVYQSLYVRTYGKKPVPVFTAESTSNYRATYPAELTPEMTQAIALEQFGECVAKADPKTVRELLIQYSGSGAESAAFATLAPRFSACIVAGENLTFSKLILKSALAEGMFRLTRATDVVASK